MRHLYYLLKDREVVPVDESEWYFQSSDERRVAYTVLGDEMHISTVFIPLPVDEIMGVPLAFETMIFGGPYDKWDCRSCTFDDAEIVHETVCENLRKGLPPDGR